MPILLLRSGIRPENAPRTMQGHAIPGGMSSESVGIGTTDSSRLVVWVARAGDSMPRGSVLLVVKTIACHGRIQSDSVVERSRLVAATSLGTAHSLPSTGCIMRVVGDNTTAGKCTAGILVAKGIVLRRGNALISHATMSWLISRSRKICRNINPSRYEIRYANL